MQFSMLSSVFNPPGLTEKVSSPIPVFKLPVGQTPGLEETRRLIFFSALYDHENLYKDNENSYVTYMIHPAGNSSFYVTENGQSH